MRATGGRALPLLLPRSLEALPWAVSRGSIPMFPAGVLAKRASLGRLQASEWSCEPLAFRHRFLSRYRETSEERRKRKERDEIREERRRERERERRLAEAVRRRCLVAGGPPLHTLSLADLVVAGRLQGEHGYKRSKLTRDRERDVSERVALGMAHVPATTGEAMYDQRLFNQESGLQSGFAAEDSYHLYDKPLFAQRETNFFRPVRNADDEQYGDGAGGAGGVDTKRFRPDKGFEGADAAGPRTGEGWRGDGMVT